MKWLYSILFIIYSIWFVQGVNHNYNTNWDIIPYMGVIARASGESLEVVQQNVYQELRDNVSSELFYYMTYEDCKQCYMAYSTVDGFEKIVDIYDKKSLKSYFSICLYRLGLSLWDSVMLPSILAVFLTLLVVLVWLQQYVKVHLAFILGVLISLLPGLYAIQNSAAPSAMVCLLMLLTLYLWVNNKNKILLVLSLLLSVPTSLNSVLLLIVIMLVELLGYRRMLLLTTLGSILFVAIIILMSYGIVPLTSRFKSIVEGISYMDRWQEVIIGVREEGYIYYLFAGIIAVYFGDNTQRKYSAALIAVFILSLLLYPFLEYRFFAAYNIAFIILLVRLLHIRYVTNLPISNRK